MIKTVLSYFLMFVLLILVQVLVFNHIALFSIAIAFIFIYFIISLPLSLSTNLLLLLSFATGFIVDVFSDTPGVNSLSCTILAILKRPVFYAYVPRDDKTKVMNPTIMTIGWAAYSKYLFTMCAIYSLLVFSIEYFSFADVKDILIMSLGATLFTFIVNLALGCIFDRKG
ncbi:MAG: rod shape-determining protein MreD [Muribaculaceae bacterium]|nr:rod shape-determining protein MreD [Muribaculaceae bacterium]